MNPTREPMFRQKRGGNISNLVLYFPEFYILAAFVFAGLVWVAAAEGMLSLRLSSIRSACSAAADDVSVPREHLPLGGGPSVNFHFRAIELHV